MPFYVEKDGDFVPMEAEGKDFQGCVHYNVPDHKKPEPVRPPPPPPPTIVPADPGPPKAHPVPAATKSLDYGRFDRLVLDSEDDDDDDDKPRISASQVVVPQVGPQTQLHRVVDGPADNMTTCTPPGQSDLPSTPSTRHPLWMGLVGPPGGTDTKDASREDLASLVAVLALDPGSIVLALEAADPISVATNYVALAEAALRRRALDYPQHLSIVSRPEMWSALAATFAAAVRTAEADGDFEGSCDYVTSMVNALIPGLHAAGGADVSPTVATANPRWLANALVTTARAICSARAMAPPLSYLASCVAQLYLLLADALLASKAPRALADALDAACAGAAVRAAVVHAEKLGVGNLGLRGAEAREAWAERMKQASPARCAKGGCEVTELTAPSSKLLRCGRCKLVRYCCAAHQKEDWRQHQPLCALACSKNG